MYAATVHPPLRQSIRHRSGKCGRGAPILRKGGQRGVKHRKIMLYQHKKSLFHCLPCLRYDSGEGRRAYVCVSVPRCGQPDHIGYCRGMPVLHRAGRLHDTAAGLSRAFQGARDRDGRFEITRRARAYSGGKRMDYRKIVAGRLLPFKLCKVPGSRRPAAMPLIDGAPILKRLACFSAEKQGRHEKDGHQDGNEHRFAAAAYF